MPLQLHKQLLP